MTDDYFKKTKRNDTKKNIVLVATALLIGLLILPVLDSQAFAIQEKTNTSKITEKPILSGSKPTHNLSPNQIVHLYIQTGYYYPCSTGTCTQITTDWTQATYNQSIILDGLTAQGNNWITPFYRMYADTAGDYQGGRTVDVIVPNGNYIYSNDASWDFYEANAYEVAEADGPQLNNNGNGVPQDTQINWSFLWDYYSS